MNIQVSRWFFILVPLLALPFIFNSCQNNSDDPGGGGGGAQSTTCKIQSSGVSALAKPEPPLPSPFAGKKLQLHSPSDTQAKATNPIVRAGNELVVLMDNECAKGSSDQSVLSKLVVATRPHPGLHQQSYTWTLTKDYRESELSTLAEQNPCVIGVSWNRKYKMQALTPTNLNFNDPQYSSQEHFSALNAPAAYASLYDVSGGLASTSGSPVIVAVVDTGVDWTHPDLATNLWRHAYGIGIDTTTIGSGVIDYNPFDVSDNGHGTHISGMIAAVTNNATGIAGLMPYRAQIMAVKIFRRDGDGAMVTTSTDLSNGVIFAANNGAKVINVSLGSVKSGAVDDPVAQNALNNAVNKGSLVVVVVGNSSDGAGALIDHSTTSSLPGQYATINGVIGVGSIDTSTGSKSYFSHYSSTYAEIGAPGAVSSGAGQSAQGLLSTVPTGVLSTGYARLAGTSQAAPAVSAAAAIAYGLVRNATSVELTPSQLEQILEDSAVKTPSLTQYFKNGNRLDYLALVRKVNQLYPATLGGRRLPGCP